jgi:hypothetical protein
MSDINEMSGAGGVAGFQLPLGIKERKPKLDQMWDKNPDIKAEHMLVFLRELDETSCKDVCDKLDSDKMDEVAELVRESMIRQVVRYKIREVVRKKAGGGGFTLYAPNKGKKHTAKPVATFPTKLAAKRAELARFPPKDPKKLQRLRKEVDRLMKDPKKRADAEKRAASKPGHDHNAERSAHGAPRVAPKAEAAQRASQQLFEAKVLAKVIMSEMKKHLNEGLFTEENPGSQWDEYIKKLSGRALQSDKNFQRHQKNIESATQGLIKSTMRRIAKSLKGAKLQAGQVKKHDDGRSYLPFGIDGGGVSISPVYLYIDKGTPRVEMSDSAKANMTKAPPELVKLIKAELSMVQEDAGVDPMNPVTQATAKRDQYLSKVERQVDHMIANMSPTQLTILKNLLVKKYRKLGA